MSLIPTHWPLGLRLLLNTVCVGLFAAHVVYHDFPLSSLPWWASTSAAGSKPLRRPVFTRRRPAPPEPRTACNNQS